MFSSLLRVVARSAATQLEEVSAKGVPPAVAKAAKALSGAQTESVKVDEDVLPIQNGMREENVSISNATQIPSISQASPEPVTSSINPSTPPPRPVIPSTPTSINTAPAATSRETPSESSKTAADRDRITAQPQSAVKPSDQPMRDGFQVNGKTTSSTTPPYTASSISPPTTSSTSSSSASMSGSAPPPPPSAKPSVTPSRSAEHVSGSSASVDPGVAPEQSEKDDAPVLLRASKVPSSKIGRFLHYGSLAASLSWGAATETVKRSAGGGSEGSVFMSDANVRRLVSSLTRMRGAALKLGQFMSIQDNHMLPPEIERVLSQVQSHANYMPDWQMERVMLSELGSDWSSLFSTFDRTPIASASIGQVHRATLKSGEDVAVKIQFPGIRDSITSDLSYLTPLLASSAILPKGLYLQNTIAVMKRELADECDYTKEAEAGRRFSMFLEGDEYFDTPKIVDEGCTERVLITSWMEGKSLSRMKGMTQETRDKIGTNILRLCLQELFHFRFMQTDPNWGNFLYNPNSDRLGLIDFGASRQYTREFMDGWFALLSAAIRGDKERMKLESKNIGYFTGEEEQVMIDAHLSSMSLLSVPFAHQGVYDFSSQTITDDVRKHIPVMLKHRLTPPPQETYSLNRKLSGAFLMCTKLGARVDCSKLWEDWAGDYPYPDPKGINW